MTLVRFPVRVALTVQADRNVDALVQGAIDAVDAALSRAVTRASTVATIRHSVTENSYTPTVTVRLSGDPLPQAQAKALTAGLSRIAGERARSLLASADAVPVPASPPGRSLAEEFDQARFSGADSPGGNDVYAVPSYGGRGRDAGVRVSGRPAPSSGPRRARLRLWRYVAKEFEARVTRHYRGVPPARFIAVVEYRGIPTALTVSAPPFGVMTWGYLGTWEMYVMPSGGTRDARGEWVFLRADSLDFHAVGDTPHKRHSIRLAEVIRALSESGGTGTADQIAREAASIVNLLADPGAERLYYYLKDRGKVVRLVEFPSIPLFPRENIPVAVLTERVEVAPPVDEESGHPQLPLTELISFTPDAAQPFLAEPPVFSWPTGIAGRLGDLMSRVAGQVGLPVGIYPGMYLLAVLARIHDQAELLGHVEGGGTRGNSRRIAVIRQYAAAFDSLQALVRYYSEVISSADEGGTLPPPLRHHSASWLLHFHEQYVQGSHAAVAALFAATCQDILLDTLEDSHREIVRRLDHFGPYMVLTRKLILMMLVDDAELAALRATLLAATHSTAIEMVAASNPVTLWWQMSKLVVSALRTDDSTAAGGTAPGSIRQTSEGYEIRDALGRWWTRAELESVLAQGRKEAISVDPLLEKLEDLPDTVRRLRSAGIAGVDREFALLLSELRAENESTTREVRADFDLAFGLARMTESDDVSGIGANLGGIHEQADAILRPLFTGGGASAYTGGLRSLAASTIGLQRFKEFMGLVGVTALSIFFPLGGTIVGLLMAVDDGLSALEHRRVQRAMLGGDAILSKAQVEAELWGAAIGFALAVAPEVKTMAKVTATGMKAVAKGEAGAVARATGRQIAEDAAKHIAQLATENLLKKFVLECFKGELLNLALGAAIGRFTDAVSREVLVSGGASVNDLPRLIADAFRGASDGAKK